MGARVTVAIVGDDLSSFANSLWATARLASYVPERLHIIARSPALAERASSIAKATLTGAARASPPPEIQAVPLDDPGFMAWGRKAGEIVKSEKDKGSEVALDVTAAPKEGAVAASIASWNRKVDHVFHLDEARYAHLDNPLLLLPLPEMHLHDYILEAREK